MQRQLNLFEESARNQIWRALPEETREELVRICVRLSVPAIQAGVEVTSDTLDAPGKGNESSS